MSSSKRKPLMNYFDFVDNRAKCKLCSSRLKCNRSFNLKSHLVNVHGVNDYEINLKSESSSKTSEKSNKKQTIKIKISRKQLFRSYVGLITEDCIPFNVLRAKNFQRIIDPICEGFAEKLGKKIPLHSNSCKDILQLVSENIRNDLRPDLYQHLFSLKIDSTAENVFGISVQFIKNSEIQSHILKIIELKDVGTNIPRNLGTQILNTLIKYDLNLKQIVSITLDNCSNLKRRVKNSAHGSSFDDENTFCNGNEIYLRKLRTLVDTFQIDLTDIQIYLCAAHAAQFCLIDVTKDSEMINFLFSCRNLVKFIRKPSNGYLDVFEANDLNVPQLDCPNKWGSTYTMINALKNSKAILSKTKSVKNKSVDENFELNVNFWNLIEAFCVAFEPLQQTIVKFKEEQLHYGDFYAQWLKCKICTEQILHTSQNDCIKKFSQYLLDAMEKRTKALLDNEIVISCLYFDPRFHHILTPAQRLVAATYLRNLYERTKNVNSYNQEIKTEPSSSVYLESTDFSEKADEYLNEYLTRNFAPSCSEGVDQVHVKLENLRMPFIRVDSNILQFWKDKQYSDPELYALSNICFSIPATHGTTEDTFSSLELTLTNNRNSVSEDTLDDILLVNMNSEYLDQAIESLPLLGDAE